MIRLYSLIVLIVIGYWGVRKLLASENSLRALYNKTPFFVIAGVMLLLLGITGHLAWVMAMIGVLIAFVVRNLPFILRFAPQLQKSWYRFRNTTQQQESAKYSPPPSRGITVMEAYKILGLTPPVAKQEIVLAHKKLMQKMHPDRGGSDYLASRINLAKDLLLKNLKHYG